MKSMLDHPRTLLGFDFGLSRIGIAVGQELTATARPLTTLTSQQQRPDWSAIGRIIEEWQPDLAIVGIPRHADGSASEMTTAALRFSRQLAGRYHLAIDTIDERLSSVAAEAFIAQAGQLNQRRRRDRCTIDQVAAALILESWFNR